ncbi:uncharacterized protein IWZ02DRAFT_156492 [Phyllosticta citriasiana]|uniref:uncharacterized protein n=1 Tax=Phyllosticta citriasiana TaxID=595635 RepID=UPI0030FD6AF3
MRAAHKRLSVVKIERTALVNLLTRLTVSPVSLPHIHGLERTWNSCVTSTAPRLPMNPCLTTTLRLRARIQPSRHGTERISFAGTASKGHATGRRGARVAWNDGTPPVSHYRSKSPMFITLLFPIAPLMLLFFRLQRLPLATTAKGFICDAQGEACWESFYTAPPLGCSRLPSGLRQDF